MTHYEIVKKLIGDVMPVGESHKDTERFENLKVLCELVDELWGDIERVAGCGEGHQEHSILKASEYAKEQLRQLFANY